MDDDASFDPELPENWADATGEMSSPALRKSGRGVNWNPKNRFEKYKFAPEPPDNPDSEDQPKPVHTQFFRDGTQTILSRNSSPDIGYGVSLNPYRGCEHGCAYCYARPTHEYLGWSSGLDFESRLLIKENAPELLRKALSSKRWEPETISLSSVTDCYQPIERQLKLTRRCLAVMAELRNPVSVITKNHLITRDVDYLGELAVHHAAEANISITTLDPALAKVLEPRASTPTRRLAAIAELSQAGVPVRVMMAPVIPGLNDHEIPTIIAAAAQAGAQEACYVPIRLPWAVAEIFEHWLEEYFPGQKAKILDRIRDLRGGVLNDPKFGSRMRGQGIYADTMRRMFTVAVRKAKLRGLRPLSNTAFRPPIKQMNLF